MRHQSGNALFLILIAVALFAALSYAITQSGRGGGTISREQSVISASQITQYPASLRMVATRMVLTGTAPTAVSFDDTAGTGVFAADGGGAIYQTPPANIGAASCDYAVLGTYADNCWGFKSLSAHVDNGFLVENIGTNEGITGREAIAYLHDISKSVCQQIDKGLTGSTDIPQQATVEFDWLLNSGLGNKNEALGDGTGRSNVLAGAGISGVAFGCIANRDPDDGPFDYYHVLIEE